MADAEIKYDLITRRLQEVLGADIIKGILAEGRTPKCYWGEPLMIGTGLRTSSFNISDRNRTNWTTYVLGLKCDLNTVNNKRQFHSSYRILRPINEDRGFPARRCRGQDSTGR